MGFFQVKKGGSIFGELFKAKESTKALKEQVIAKNELERLNDPTFLKIEQIRHIENIYEFMEIVDMHLTFIEEKIELNALYGDLKTLDIDKRIQDGMDSIVGGLEYALEDYELYKDDIVKEFELLQGLIEVSENKIKEMQMINNYSNILDSAENRM
jgi:hypothetical protein